MNMHPPAQVNARVMEDMLRWVMLQSNTVTMNTITNEFTIAPGPSAKDYPIDDRTRQFMLYELQCILSFNQFQSELLDNGSLKISKDRWALEVDNILNQLPFADALLAQIENSYNYHVQDAAFNEMVFSGGVMMQVDYGLPRPSRFIDMREIVEDFINDTNKD